MKIESIGAKLKKIRLEKGLALEEAQKKTKIQLSILQAIEGDSITNLNPVYLKGFLKIYCQFLGLDPKGFAPDAKAKPQAAPVAAARPEAPPAAEKEAKPRVSPVLDNSAMKPGSPYIGKIALAVTLILIIFGLFKFGKFISSRAALRPKAVTAVAARAASKPRKDKAENRQPSRAAQRPKPQPSLGPINLTIRARQNCLVVLKADGKLIFHRVLEKNRFENWQAKERFDLLLGNAGGVDLEVNGRLFANLGGKREARKNIVITKEGLTVK